MQQACNLTSLAGRPHSLSPQGYTPSLLVVTPHSISRGYIYSSIKYTDMSELKRTESWLYPQWTVSQKYPKSGHDSEVYPTTASTVQVLMLPTMTLLQLCFLSMQHLMSTHHWHCKVALQLFDSDTIILATYYYYYYYHCLDEKDGKESEGLGYAMCQLIYLHRIITKISGVANYMCIDLNNNTKILPLLLPVLMRHNL